MRLVWYISGGYPVSGEYRDYHGRTVHDLKPWNNAGRPYRHSEALALAREHARDFVERAIARLDAHRGERGRPGLLCCPLDAELLGHWWYEGPAWLAGVLDEARARGLRLATVSEALERHRPVERPLAASSWGTPKDLSTWDSPRVFEIVAAARRAEARTVAAASGPHGRGDHADGALGRAARELLALQSSDWAFQATRELAADYPLERVRAHAAALDAGLAALKDSPTAVSPSLRNLAPELELWPLRSP